MPIDPARLATLWPRTAAALERLGVVWDAGALPESVAADVAWAAVILRAPKSHLLAERRQAVERIVSARAPESAALLVETVLRDPSRNIRVLALQRLAASPGPSVDGALALGLADTRSKEVKRVTSRLLGTRGPAPFGVILALWEDRAADRVELAMELAACAERAPRVGMRPALAVLDKEARRLFQPAWRRASLQNCVRRIDAATAALKDLPLTASAASSDQNLPLPSAAPDDAPALARRPWWRRLLDRF